MLAAQPQMEVDLPYDSAGLAPVGRARNEEVADFLKDNGLAMYTSVLMKNGFDDMETLMSLTDRDMADFNFMPQHANLLRRKLLRLRGAEEEIDDQNPVLQFLNGSGFEPFGPVLLEHGFDDMETLLLADDFDFKDMGFKLGHVVKMKKRLRQHELNHNMDGDLPPEWQLPEERPRGAERSAALIDVTGLSASGLSAVEKSWEKVQKLGVTAVGGLLYQHFFQMAPEAKELYPAAVRRKYSEWTIDEDKQDLFYSGALRKLFGKVINAVGCTVVGFQDMDKLVPMLERLGARHGSYGVGEHQYALLGKALEMTLADLLGDEYQGEVQQNWSLVFSLMTAVMLEGHRQAIAEQARRAEERRELGLDMS